VSTFKEKNDYPKLEPTNAKNIDLLKEGEGILTAEENPDKRSPFDFALWKTSKP